MSFHWYRENADQCGISKPLEQTNGDLRLFPLNGKRKEIDIFAIKD